MLNVCKTVLNWIIDEYGKHIDYPIYIEHPASGPYGERTHVEMRPHASPVHYVIRVGESSNEVLSCAIAHEVGHIVHGHLALIIRGIRTTINENFRYEHEADLFAARILGKNEIIRWLEYLCPTHYGFCLFSTTHPPCRERIAYVNKNI